MFIIKIDANPVRVWRKEILLADMWIILHIGF